MDTDDELEYAIRELIVDGKNVDDVFNGKYTSKPPPAIISDIKKQNTDTKNIIHGESKSSKILSRFNEMFNGNISKKSRLNLETPDDGIIPEDFFSPKDEYVFPQFTPSSPASSPTSSPASSPASSPTSSPASSPPLASLLPAALPPLPTSSPATSEDNLQLEYHAIRNELNESAKTLIKSLEKTIANNDEIPEELFKDYLNLNQKIKDFMDACDKFNKNSKTKVNCDNFPKNILETINNLFESASITAPGGPPPLPTSLPPPLPAAAPAGPAALPPPLPTSLPTSLPAPAATPAPAAASSASVSPQTPESALVSASVSASAGPPELASSEHMFSAKPEDGIKAIQDYCTIKAITLTNKFPYKKLVIGLATHILELIKVRAATTGNSKNPIIFKPGDEIGSRTNLKNDLNVMLNYLYNVITSGIKKPGLTTTLLLNNNINVPPYTFFNLKDFIERINANKETDDILELIIPYVNFVVNGFNEKKPNYIIEFGPFVIELLESVCLQNIINRLDKKKINTTFMNYLLIEQPTIIKSGGANSSYYKYKKYKLKYHNLMKQAKSMGYTQD